MRIRFGKNVVLSVVICILLAFCAGCGDSSHSGAETPVPAPESSSAPEIESLLPEQVLEDKIIGRVSASGYIPEEEREFLEEYNAFFSGDEAVDPLDLLMDTYALSSEIQVELLDGSTALVHVDVPNLPEILKSAISSLSEGEKSAGNASELIQMAAQEILASGEFERKTTDVTVLYTLSADGIPEIVESREYLNALYGGLLTSAEELFEQTQMPVDDGEVAK